MMGSPGLAKIERLGLGTVQFGSAYGISNQEGQTPADEVARILDLASRSGIRIIDTAAAYGDSESVLGQTLPPQHQLRIVTKTAPIGRARITHRDALALPTTFQRSLTQLRSDCAYGLLVHQADDLLADGGELLFEAMEKLKSQRLVEKIGVSVYTGEQIERLLNRYQIDIIQLPINLFDQRLLAAGYLDRLKTAGVEIHARSVFLQGLLLMSPTDLPSHLRPIRSHLARFHEAIEASGRTALEAALDFVWRLKQIDCVVVGVCSCSHLSDIVDSVNSADNGSIDYSQFALDDEKVINPANWKVDQHESEICR